MFIPDREFILPRDNNCIFRYTDLWKFVSLLTEKTIYLCRVDLLQDHYEGFYLNDYIEYLKKTLQTLKINNPEKELTSILSHLDGLRTTMYVNCWCLKSHELATMWEAYCKNENEEFGIAIQSNIGKLKKAFSASKEPIRIGKVHYLNYRKSSSVFLSSIASIDNKKKPSSMVLDTVFSPFLYKQQYWKDERELRCLLWKPELFLEKKECPTGFHIPINIEDLIQTIYTDPRAPKSFVVEIKDLVRAHGYRFDIKQSHIAIPPSSYPDLKLIK